MVSFIKPSAAANMKQYLMPSYGEIMKHALTCKAIGAEVCSSVWCEFVLVKVNMNQLGVILYLNMYVCKFEPIQHVFRQKAFCKESILFHSYTLFYSLQRGQGIFIAINYTHVFSGDPFDVLFGYHPCVGDSSLYDSYVEMIDDFWALRAIPDSVFYDKAVAITCGLRYDADAQSLWHDHLLDILTRRDREAERLIDRVALLRRGHQMQFWSFVWSAIVDVDDGGKRDFHRAYWALSQDGRDL